MAKETLVTLDGASITSGKWNKGSKFTYKLEGADPVDYTVDKDGLDAVTIAGLGTFKTTATDSSVVAFTADAALDGALKIESGTNSKTSVASLDFSAATDGISYAVDTDDKTVVLGAGADTIDIQTATATATVNGYSYEDGDVISVASGKSAGYALTNEGLFASVGGSDSSVKVATDGTQIYKAKATDGKGSTQYWTGVAQGTANEFDASAVSDKIIIDASTSKKADVKLGSGAAAVSIGAGTVASGSGNDTITATGALTLSIGRNDGEDSVASSIKGSDTIIFENGKLSRIDSIAGQKIVYAQTTVDAASVESAFNVQFGTDASTLGKLQWGETIDAATDTTYFYGTKTDNKSALNAAAAKVNYDLSDSSKFHNIHYVSLQSATSGDVKLTNDGDTIVSAAADAALTFTLGQGSDSISLNSANKQATTIVTSAVSGNDTITGFKTGFADTADILQLSDLSSLDDITIGEKAGLISFDKQDSISLAGAITDDGLRVKFAGSDAVKKVAVALGGDTDTVIAAGADADIVLGKKDGKTLYSVTGGADTDVTFFAFNDTAKYKNIHNIDLTGKKGQNIVVGTTDADTIALSSVASAVWGGGSEDDVISLTSSKHEGAHIWFGAGDGGDEVKNFRTTDDVYFYGAETLGDIAKNFTFSNDGTDITITSKSDKHDSLKLTGYKDTLTVLSTMAADGTTKKTKVQFADNSGASFATDSLIYVGTADNAKVTVSSSLDNENAVYTADLRGDAGISEAKFYDVKQFDASKSYAQYILIGSGESTLTGGQTKNAYWGGSSDSQTFHGQKGVTDYFWFGAGDGHDTAENVGSEDAVYLWSTNNIDDVKVTTNGTNVDVIYANENDLTLTGAVAAVKAGLTFMTSDMTEYTYDFKTQSFSKKTKA